MALVYSDTINVESSIPSHQKLVAGQETVQLGTLAKIRGKWFNVNSCYIVSGSVVPELETFNITEAYVDSTTGQLIIRYLGLSAQSVPFERPVIFQVYYNVQQRYPQYCGYKGCYVNGVEDTSTDLSQLFSVYADSQKTIVFGETGGSASYTAPHYYFGARYASGGDPEVVNDTWNLPITFTNKYKSGGTDLPALVLNGTKPSFFTSSSSETVPTLNKACAFYAYNDSDWIWHYIYMSRNTTNNSITLTQKQSNGTVVKTSTLYCNDFGIFQDGTMPKRMLMLVQAGGGGGGGGNWNTSSAGGGAGAYWLGVINIEDITSEVILAQLGRAGWGGAGGGGLSPGESGVGANPVEVYPAGYGNASSYKIVVPGGEGGLYSGSTGGTAGDPAGISITDSTSNKHIWTLATGTGLAGNARYAKATGTLNAVTLYSTNWAGYKTGCNALSLPSHTGCSMTDNDGGGGGSSILANGAGSSSGLGDRGTYGAGGCGSAGNNTGGSGGGPIIMIWF